jgi:hypothetical protein
VTWHRGVMVGRGENEEIRGTRLAKLEHGQPLFQVLGHRDSPYFFHSNLKPLPKIAVVLVAHRICVLSRQSRATKGNYEVSGFSPHNTGVIRPSLTFL